MEKFLDSFGEVLERGSGAASFGIIQALMMCCAVIAFQKYSDYRYWVVFTVAIVSTIGFMFCIASLMKIINEVTAKEPIKKCFLYALFYPSVMGILGTAIISVKALA